MNITKFYDYTFDKSYVFNGHRHFEYEINVIKEGELQVIYDDKCCDLKKGEVFLCEPYVFHRNLVKTEKVSFYVFHFKCDYSLIGKSGVYEMKEQEKKIFDLLIEELSILKKDNSKNEAEFGVVENALYTAFIEKLINKGLKEKVAFKNSELYCQAVQFMNENINLKLTVKDIAKQLCVSDSTLKKIFKKVAGIGVIKYFNELKLTKAQKMLLSGKSVLETGFELGYSSPSYFSAAFKNATDKSPLKYKKENK